MKPQDHEHEFVRLFYVKAYTSLDGEVQREISPFNILWELLHRPLLDQLLTAISFQAVFSAGKLC